MVTFPREVCFRESGCLARVILLVKRFSRLLCRKCSRGGVKLCMMRGVRQTYACVLPCLFWDWLKHSVPKMCHTCQLTGKPWHVTKPARLSLIPVVSCSNISFHRRLSGAFTSVQVYQATRYPAACPLRFISVKLALTHLVSIFV